MTTLVIVHNAHRKVVVNTLDRVYDHENKVMTDDWTRTSFVVEPGNLYQTYCTDTRKIEVVEE